MMRGQGVRVYKRVYWRNDGTEQLHIITENVQDTSGQLPPQHKENFPFSCNFLSFPMVFALFCENCALFPLCPPPPGWVKSLTPVTIFGNRINYAHTSFK